MDLSIIIPAYNEAERLPSTLRRIDAYLRARPTLGSEIIVVDDGSSDQTAALAKTTLAGVRVISQGHNMGKGAAIRTGMLAAQGEWRYMCDADLSTPIEELDKLMSFGHHADVVIGSRRMPGAQITKAQAKWKVVLGQMGNMLIQVLVVPGIHDTQCGFKLFHQRTMGIFSLQRNNRFGYDFEILYLARRGRWRIKEVPVEWANDERTTVRTRDYAITLFELLAIHWHQLRGHYKSSL
jgi:dolichyl-phosphate beta-glucosyltransferase